MFAIEAKSFDPNSYSSMEKNEDGTYSFLVSFYNGGAGLGEVLEGALQKQNRES